LDFTDNPSNLSALNAYPLIEKIKAELKDLLDNILTLLEKKNYAGGLFCGLQKAFDCVSHNVLLERNNFYGISGSAINLYHMTF
jgi:hypothetical protein